MKCMITLLRMSASFGICISLLLAQLPDSTVVMQVLPKAAYDTTTINFKDTDLRDIFRAIAYQHGINIFVENNVVKKSTISLYRVQVYDAIKFLCEQNNLELVIEGGIFKIAPQPAPVIIKEEPKMPYVGYERGNLFLEVKNTDLELFISAIQQKTNKNILITSGTSGTISGKLIDIDFDLGFIQLLNNNGFAVQKKNNIYVVNRLDYFIGSPSGPPGQKTGPYWISVKDSLITIDVTNAPLERVIADIIRQLNTDVVFYNSVSGNVTARASNMSLSRALDMILRNTSFTYRESDGIYFVGEKTNKTMMSTRLIKLKYLRSEKFIEMVPQSISSLSTLKSMKEHNGIVAIAANDVVNQLEEFIAQIDKPVAQVLIEALVVDFNINNGLDLGVNAGIRSRADTSRTGDLYIPGLDLLFGNKVTNEALNAIGSTIGVANLGTLPANFYMNIRALEEKGIAKVRSRPLIATLNGHQASLSIGTTQYYKLKSTIPYRDQSQVVFQETEQFQTIEANVKLEITPYVGSNGLITVEIKPDFKNPVGKLSPDVPPTISQRAMSSTVLIKEGETIVLGGLIQETDSETRSQVPLLGDIPWIGTLFSSTSTIKEKTELIIYVTPHISYGEAFQNVYLPNVKSKD